MCGLVGVAGNLFKKHTDAFGQLLVADMFRGMHSTGVASVGASANDVLVHKRAISGADFVQLRVPANMYALTRRAIMGHNRHATAGTITDSNAHPFQHGPITLMHNGTLTTRHGLTQTTLYSVDSENIAYQMSIMEDPHELLSELDGAFALVWHDARDNTLNFARNERRTLEFAWMGDSMAWASEGAMLKWILERNDLKPENYIPLQPGKHLVVSLGAQKLNEKSWSVRDFKPYEPAFSYNRVGGNKNLAIPSLFELGFKHDEEVYFTLKEFTPYSGVAGTGTGTARGKLWDGSEEIVIYNVRKDKFKFHGKGTLPIIDEIYAARIQGIACHSKCESGYALSLKPTSVMNADDYQEFKKEEKEDAAKKQLPAKISSGRQPSQQSKKQTKGGEPSANVVLTTVDGKALALGEATKLAAKGCCWCGNPFSFDELETAPFWDGEYVHFDTCYEDMVHELQGDPKKAH